MDITEWRPISLLLTSYKLFMTIVQSRVMPWIVDTQRLSPRQKGSLPRNGLQEHVFCLQSGISDFMHSSSKHFVTFIDLKDAFGSIDHIYMIRSLELAGYPPWIVDITRDIYTGSTFQVKTSGGFTESIARHRGIVQGCPWSLICFEQGIDPWLRWIDEGSPPTQIPAPIQGYVDDVSTTSKTEPHLQEVARKTDSFANFTGTEVKHRKCAIQHGQRTGNNWSKNSKTGDVKVTIQNADLPVYDRDDSYPYLGYDIKIDAKSEQTTQLIADFVKTLDSIDSSLLPTSAKLEAINTMCMSKLNFYFPNLFFTEKELIELEDQIVGYVRHWLCLNNSSTRCYFFTPKSKGGLGLLNPHVIYYAKHLQFYLDVLNNDDLSVRHAARDSLKLHMTKRKCVTDTGDNSFAGYAVNDGKLVKQSKVCWSKSQWVHLFEMCHRENIQLRFRVQSDKYVFVLNVDDDISFQFHDPKVFYARYKETKMTQFKETWHSMMSQGRVARESSEYVDYRNSSAFLGNHKVSDDLRSFVCRGRLQLLQCNSLLHLYYGVPKNCKLCNFHSDTASHLLNGCAKQKNLYQQRHDRIVELVHLKIKSVNSKRNTHVIKDSFITPQVFGSQQSHFQNPHTRPDITVIDRDAKTAMIIEISVPFDAHMSITYEQKYQKYFPLSLEINELGYSTKIVVLIVGSLGFVHSRFASGLKLCGISRAEAKFLASYCSISAIIGSHRAWKLRCKQLGYN